MHHHLQAADLVVGPDRRRQPQQPNKLRRHHVCRRHPVPIDHPEPQFSEEARKAKWQGAVMLSLVVDEHGKPTAIHVIRPLGLGLDEKAIEAVQKWTFKPGMKDGKPVAVQAQIEVTFRLL